MAVLRDYAQGVNRALLKPTYAATVSGDFLFGKTLSLSQSHIGPVKGLASHLLEMSEEVVDAQSEARLKTTFVPVLRTGRLYSGGKIDGEGVYCGAR